MVGISSGQLTATRYGKWCMNRTQQQLNGLAKDGLADPELIGLITLMNSSILGETQLIMLLQLIKTTTF